MIEKADIKRNKSGKSIVICIIIFLAVALLRPAKTDYAIVYMIIAIGFLTAAAYLIIYKYMASYTYQITENELVFIKNIGSHERYMMIAPLSRIEEIIKKCHANNEIYKNINYPVGDKFVGAYYVGQKTVTFSFSPSRDMQKLLKSKIGDRFQA